LQPYRNLLEPVVGNESPQLVRGFAVDGDFGTGVAAANCPEASRTRGGFLPLETWEHASRRSVFHHHLNLRRGEIESLGMFFQDFEHVSLTDLLLRPFDRLVGNFT